MDTDKESRIIIATVIFGDLLILNLIFYLVSLFDIKPYEDMELVQHFVVLTLCYLVSLSMFGGVKLYRRQVRADQVVGTVFGNIFGFFGLWLAMRAIMGGTLNVSWDHIIFALFVLFAITLYRLIYQSVLRGIRSRGSQQCNVVFVGSTKNMSELYHDMERNHWTGYKVLGYFDVEPNEKFEAEYLGHCDEIAEYLSEHHVHRLYCSLPSAMKDTILPIISYCESHLVRFYSVPNLRNYLSRRVTLEAFSSVPVLSIRQVPLTKFDNRFVKRTFDIIFSSLFLVTLFPIVLIIFGTLIKLSSKGPIFFRQKRHGLDGKEFWCYKFRSMRVNVESDALQASEHDPRKTRVGDFMRRTSIDELPQFLNVFFGTMSVVGPRPHMLKHTEEYSKLIDSYMVRHLVKPGVTGWAQVTGFRGETKELSEMEGRVRADIWYMEHWTAMLDLYIIYKTVANVVRRKDKKAY